MIWQTLVFILFGYLCGSIMFGSILSRFIYKKNIRKYGSHNPGAANVGRNFGKIAGFLTFALDALKASLAIGICLILKQNINEFKEVNIFVAGLGSVLGHSFSCFSKFNGGKGVATSMGALMTISPFFFPILAVSWVGGMLLTSYASVASIMWASTALVVGLSIPQILQENIVYDNFSFEWSKLDYKIAICIIIGICLLVIIKHHENIKRLLNNTERKANWLSFVKKIITK